MTIGLSTCEQVCRGLLDRCFSIRWVLGASNNNPLALRRRNTISFTNAFNFVFRYNIVLRDHRDVVSSSIRRIARTRCHRLALSQECVNTSRRMRGIKTWQERPKVRVIKVVLGMCHLKPVNMLHSEYLPAEHPFVSITILEGPDERSVHLVKLLLGLHMSLLMVLYVLHALFDNFSEALEIDVEITLHWRCVLLYHLFDQLTLNFVDFCLRVCLKCFFDLVLQLFYLVDY